jgi:membrane protease subunit HflC
MQKKSLILAILAVIAVMAVVQITFTVDETEKAIILQLGKPVGDAVGPGLAVKIPFIQEVIRFDSRILDYDAQPAEILTKDKKNMVVDNYTKWRIVDPLQYYRTLRLMPTAQSRLDDIIYSELRVALGRYTLIEIVSTKRDDIMRQVTTRANELVQRFGIEVVDVRIKRTDLPAENERAIFGRMRAERERQAKQYRSEGQEASSRIKADADRERTVIIAEAKREANVLRGEGDAEATRIYADALGRDTAFYEFQRSLEAYRKSLESNSQLVITPDTPFFDYLK